MGLLETIVGVLNPVGEQVSKLWDTNWLRYSLYGIGGLLVLLFLILKALSGQ